MAMTAGGPTNVDPNDLLTFPYVHDWEAVPAKRRPMAIVSALPLGPWECFTWRQDGREDAEIFFEMRHPFRVFLRVFVDGEVFSESGWHGVAYRQRCSCSFSRRTRSGIMHRQMAGDECMEINGFRYAGHDASWFHNDLELEKKHDEEIWSLTKCGCGVKHKVTMFRKYNFEPPPDIVVPGPTVVRGFYVESQPSSAYSLNAMD